MFVRTLGWLVTVIVAGWTGNRIAWNPNLLKELSGFWPLLFIAIGIIALFWGWRQAMRQDPTPGIYVLGIVLGAMGAFFGRDLFEGLGWNGSLLVVGGLVVAALLWGWTIRPELYRLASPSVSAVRQAASNAIAP